MISPDQLMHSQEKRGEGYMKEEKFITDYWTSSASNDDVTEECLKIRRTWDSVTEFAVSSKSDSKGANIAISVLRSFSSVEERKPNKSWR